MQSTYVWEVITEVYPYTYAQNTFNVPKLYLADDLQALAKKLQGSYSKITRLGQVEY